MALSGTLLNCAAILAGSVIGLLIRAAGQRLPCRAASGSASLGERLRTIIMQGIGLCILCIGLSGSLKGQRMLVAILSMVLGSLLGELLDLDRRMQALGDWVQAHTSCLLPAGPGAPSVSEGFVTTSLLFCVGAMSIVGALENGLTGSTATLQAKALLDGISSIVFASTLGIGVMLSCIAVLLYQGGIALLASLLAPLLSDAVIAEITCVGSLLIIAMALNLLHITKIKVMNMVPAIFLPILLCLFL